MRTLMGLHKWKNRYPIIIFVIMDMNSANSDEAASRFSAGVLHRYYRTSDT